MKQHIAIELAVIAVRCDLQFAIVNEVQAPVIYAISAFMRSGTLKNYLFRFKRKQVQYADFKNLCACVKT